jgi:polysaccharide transporter, PST family
VWKAVAVQGGTQLLSAVVSNVVAARTVRLGPPIFEPRFAWQQVRDGWHQFISYLSTSFYTQINGVFLGFLSSPVQLGLLTGSQRISSAFQGLVVPINLAIYPQINYLTEHDPPAAVRLMGRVFAAQAVFAGCLGVAMYLAAPFIVPRFLGGAFASAVPVVQVLAFLPFLAGITNVLGQDILLPLGLKAGYTASLVGAGLVNVALLCVLVRPFGAIGSASASIITEVALALMMGRAIWRGRGVLARMRRGEKP